jgi:diguanylate cyclase (GGDEF)-like protein
LLNINAQVEKLERTEQSHDAHLLALLDQSQYLAEIQIEFKTQVQEWKDILLRGNDAELYKKYWAGFERSEAIVNKKLLALQHDLRAQPKIEQIRRELLTPTSYNAPSYEQLHAIEQRDLARLSFAEKVDLAIEAHQQLGVIYREFLTRFPLSENRDYAFEVDKNVRGIDRWLSTELDSLRAESITTQTSLQALASAQQQQEIHDLRLDIQRTVLAVLVALVAKLLLLIDRIRSSLQELNTVKRDADAVIYQLAYSDTLTGLPNRRMFQDRLNQALHHSKETGHYGGVIFLDLDNFKSLNDSKGHAQGDLLLIEVAQRLRANVRASDVVARLGGDEFVVVLNDLRGDYETAAEQASIIAEKVCLALSGPYPLTNHIHHGSASIGVALFNHGEVDADEILKRADSAMYQAKRAGRNTVCFYDEGVQDTLEAHSKLENALHAALNEHQLELYYQVQVDRNRHAIGAATLLRWHHPELGMMYPAQFISLAEESDLILHIADWMLNQACVQLKQWEASPHTRDLVLSMNVSAEQLRRAKQLTQHESGNSTAKLHKPNFVAQVQIALQKSGINPARLQLEIVESIALEDLEYTIALLQDLKALGIRIAMSEFGTGHASLTQLKRMPLDQIKIAPSCVAEISSDTYEQAIVKSIIDMAATMSLTLLAEGVETAAQADELSAQGCHNFQGHLFGQPLALEEFEQSLRKVATR